jgi:hypothetical protein
MATNRRRRSSQSPMLSLSPVSDPVRDVLNAQVRHFSTLVGWATLVVAIGVALEGVEIVHDIIAWWKRKRREERDRSDLTEVVAIFPAGEVRSSAESHSDHPRWVKRFTRIGLIVVVLGVVAEWRCGAKLEDAHNSVHEYDIALLGDAAKSAKTAHDEADAVDREYKDLKTRLDAASEQLNWIEQRVRAQGPRWFMLVKNKAKFIDDMRPFKDTKLTVLICGGGVSPPEQLGTEQRLLEFLGKTPIGANWDTGYGSWHECPNTSSNGLEMVLSENAGRDTKKAGETLKDELLAFGIATSLDVVPLDRAKFMALTFGADSPWAKAVQEPNTIFLLVAPSAMVESAKPNKRAIKTPR